MAGILNIDNGSFKEIVIEADMPYLVDFWAPWCGPCRAIAPIIEELAGEYSGKMGFAKVNVDESPQVATEYGIQSIPTLLIFKDGKPMKQVVGLTPKPDLKKHLDSILSN